MLGRKAPPAYMSLNNGRHEEPLLQEGKYTDRDSSETGKETVYLREPQRQWAWIGPAFFAALIMSNAFSLTAYLLKTPSDKEATEQVSLWCKFEPLI